MPSFYGARKALKCSGGPESPYAAASLAYFAAAPITDTTQKNAIDTAYRALVAANQYNLLLRWYPCAGDTLSASLMDFVTLTRATSVLTFTDPLNYDVASGWYFTGTQYITTGFTPSTNGGALWTDDMGYLAADVSQLDTEGVFAGAQGGGRASYLLYSSGSAETSGAINVAAVTGYSACGFAMGIYSILRYQTSFTHLFLNGSEVVEDNTTNSLAPSNREIFIGCMNDSVSGPSIFFSGLLAGARMGGQTDPSIIDPIIGTMNASFGRPLI